MANFELARMRIEQNIEEKSSENMITENGTVSAMEKPSTSNANETGTPGPNANEDFFHASLEPSTAK